MIQPRHGGKILADQLAILGATRLFCVPGESFLGLLDGLHDHQNGIQTVACRHEAGATNAAEAHGKLTGLPGLAAVTRGPGATNGSNGVHTAFQDSTPMILFIGQVNRGMLDREAFQEMDYRRVFGEMAKWVAEIGSADRIPEYVGRAWETALSGRPGPVVLALPEETLREEATVEDLRPIPRIDAAPSAAALSRLEEMIAAAEAPLLLLGGAGWSHDTQAAAQAFAERLGLPVATSLRRQDHFDNAHPNFAGAIGIAPNPALAKRVREEVDLIVNIGSRLGEMTSQGYELFGVPTPRMRLVTVHPGPEEPGMVHRPDLSIACGAAAFFEAARILAPRPAGPHVARMRAEFEAYSTPPPPQSGNGVDLGEAMLAMAAALPDDAILTNGAGNYTVWLHRFHQHRRHATQLAPTSGSMGYGTPAAVAAALEHPDRVVVNVAGDGCFLMTGQELATARQHGAKIITLVCDNGMYGTIRMHQERRHPGRVIATDLFNPDFVLLAKGYGGDGERVERTEDFAAAFQRALAAPGCYLLHLKTDPEQITPAQTLSAARAQGEAAG